MISPKFVTIFGTMPGGGGAAGPNVIQNNGDNQDSNDYGLVTASFSYGFDGTGWDRLRTDNSTGAVSSATQGDLRTIGLQYVWDPTGGLFRRVLSAPTTSDGNVAATYSPSPVSVSFLEAFNGTSFDRVRIANTYKTADVTAAGLTAVWTPTAGKKFRLMGYTISAAGTLAATSVNQIQLRDGAATVIARHNASMTVTTPTGDTQIGSDLGQGYLSTTINNVLNVNLGLVVTNGSVAVNVWGTEE